MFYITLALFARDNNCSVSALACSSFVAWIALLSALQRRRCKLLLIFRVAACVCLWICACTLSYISSIFTRVRQLCAYQHRWHILTTYLCVCVCVLIRGGKWEVTGSAQQWAGFKNIANCQEIFCAQLSTRTHTKWHIAWSSSAKLVGWVFSCNSKQD